MTWIKENIKWIVFIVFALIITNLLTGISINGISKKDQRKQQHKFDSLQNKYKQLDFVHVVEHEKMKQLSSQDSLLKIAFNKKPQRDNMLIKKQEQALTRFQKLNSNVNISKLDSAYNAEN